MLVEIYTSDSENSITVFEKGTENNIKLLPKDALLLRTIEGVDWNDCMKQHHELMGWEPYKPIEE